MARRPRSLDPSNLVSNDEIAHRCNVKVDTVHKWKQRYDDFPAPIAQLAIGPVYWWPEVEEWFKASLGRAAG